MDKKIISILLIATFCLSFLIQSPAFANTSEPWEVELETCLSQKKKASLLITNDISGSTSSTDPKGLRGSSTVAITRGLKYTIIKKLLKTICIFFNQFGRN